jgi:hypothetical protein
MWKAKTKVIPVNRGIWNHLTIRQYLSNTLGKHKIKELKKERESESESYLALHTYCGKC